MNKYHVQPVCFLLYSFATSTTSFHFTLSSPVSRFFWRCSPNASVSSTHIFCLICSSFLLLTILKSALDDPTNQWKYCPSVPAAFILFVLFACTTLFHIYQAYRYKKAFCWVLIMGGLWETLSFASRIASAHSPSKKGIYDASFLLLIISPLLSKLNMPSEKLGLICLVNAFDYMLLGRMVTFYLPDDKLAGIRGSKMGVIFVCFDIMQVVQCSFVVVLDC